MLKSFSNTYSYNLIKKNQFWSFELTRFLSKIFIWYWKSNRIKSNIYVTLQTWNLSQIKQSQNSYSRNWSRLFTPYDDLGQVMSFLFFTLEIIRTLLQPRRSFVLVGWSFLEGTSHFLVVCADRLTTLVLEKKQDKSERRDARPITVHTTPSLLLLEKAAHSSHVCKLLCTVLCS